MDGIVVIELKGFSEIAGPLLYRMEKLGLRDTQIKLKYRNIVTGLVNKSFESFKPISCREIGGDTWVIHHKDFKTAIMSAALILRLSYEQVIKVGIYYLKPVVAVGEASPVFEGNRFLDNKTISIYRVADCGEPFALYVVDPPEETQSLIPIDLNDKLEKLSNDNRIEELDWMSYNFDDKSLDLHNSFYLSSLLHDNDIAYFQSNNESLSKFSELQHMSNKVFAFGGAVKFKSPPHDDYVRSMFSLFRDRDIKCYALTYLDKCNSKLDSYYWLSLCRLFLDEHPEKFTFSFYDIDISKVKPLSYHIYNDEYVHLVLRSYQPAEDTHSMSSSVLVNNTALANKFIDEFLENFRKIPNTTAHIIDSYIDQMDIDESMRTEVSNHITSLRSLV